jgi:hypothetical protein
VFFNTRNGLRGPIPANFGNFSQQGWGYPMDFLIGKPYFNKFLTVS